MNTIHRPSRLHGGWSAGLAALALAAAAACAPAWAQPASGPGAGMGPGPGGQRGMGHHGMGHHGGPRGGEGMMGPGMMLSPRMLDAVKATPEQRAQIQQIMGAAKRDLATQRDARRALRDEAQRVFTQPNVDATAAEALRQKMLAQHDQASRRHLQAMVEASRVLTPDQRKQMADLARRRGEMMERHRRERESLAPKS
jgi:protein CpxP